jgi:hypothetical protein
MALGVERENGEITSAASARVVSPVVWKIGMAHSSGTNTVA